MLTSGLSKRSMLALSAAVAAVALVGCPDPQERFDDFVDRTKQGGTGGTGGSGGAPGGEVADLNGRFLLSIATSLAPATPLLFEATVTMRLGPGNTCPLGACSLDLIIQPLVNPFTAASPCPGVREPIGDPITLQNVSVDEHGSFVAVFEGAQVSACANPISPRPIEATLNLAAVTLDADLFCGDVSGSTTKPAPLPLAGSKFGAIRIPEGKGPADVEIVDHCPAAPGGDGGAGGSDGAAGAGGSP
ncbi:hypothetical protein [Vulgatibacter incomptus]|uniref:Lipoprotein n=1 Tax=Vulgatibacter incomptus TaxID=1391653 RepID=A0A0K1PFW4_9BACT|nr:hypothetical protein [Vulgatibacter incomptus]AKU92397.1 hypothetical protein AKJ08_2784 [Vulgatibacter incomptus]